MWSTRNCKNSLSITRLLKWKNNVNILNQVKSILENYFFENIEYLDNLALNSIKIQLIFEKDIDITDT